MTYPETIKYLESFINYEKLPAWSYKKSLKLERIRGFLTIINNPQDALKCIHIAGSKGKGSTCAFVSYILREAGFKVGLYTSPHLSDFRERIRILFPKTDNRKPITDFEGMISKKGLIELVKKLRPAIEKYNRVSAYGSLSFFEIYTALAFLYFKNKKADFVVLETGLGGRLDATNAADALISVITPISYEHTQMLGNTLRAIAKEKAMIIKSGQPIAVSSPQEKEALKVIKDRCAETSARLIEINKDIFYRKTKSGFEVKGLLNNYLNLKTRLLGKHQLVNAAAAIGAVEALCSYGKSINARFVRKGIFNTFWPGRCEVVSRKPIIILDGAQNAASMRVLRKTVQEEFKYKRLILVLGVSCDKDITGICREICFLADKIILTKADNPRALSLGRIEKIISAQGASRSSLVIKTENVKDALLRAKDSAGKNDLILVTGSLFVVGEFRDENR